MSDIILPHGEQKDGSVVDVYGNSLSLDERLEIIEQVEGLPATGMKDDIVNAVKNNSIVIINGETGSGKTTQIGKMLFDPKKQIVITQPRVLSAMSNADRVSKELLADSGKSYYSLGHGVGYRTGRGVSSTRTSPLSFHTDGLELMRSAYSNLVPDILVLDEVHNFAIPTEILAMLMKRKRDVKIIIMSATLDASVFQEYYRHVSSDIPEIKIPGRTHPVTSYFNPPGENHIESLATHYAQGKNILFFVPGKREIEDNIALLRAKLGKEAEIFPLHADLPKEEQQKLLIKSTDKPRIIVCTNVAEESITIPYIDMVMDLGTHKVASYNNLGIQELRLENTAQANCKQRAGRAGRTHPGVYIRANDTSFDELAKYPEAPLEREMLDKYILILLANGIDIEKLQEEEVANGRRLFLHDFNSKLLSISYNRLAQIGAIDHMKHITPLGRDLLKFPLDIYHARMLREAIKRECVEDIIYATTILEKKGFVSKDEKWKEIKMLGGKDSDLFGYTELFKLMTATTLPEKKREQLLSLGLDRDELSDFMDRGGEYKLYELVDLAPLGVKNKKIKEIDELVMSLRERLTASGVDITSSSNMAHKKICLAAGSLFNVYKYDEKTKKFHNREHKVGKNTLYFNAGNVTLVEPTNSHLYLGQPFIIGGGEYSGDLNLLTFLTQVDEGHIQDAKLSTHSFIASAHKIASGEDRKNAPGKANIGEKTSGKRNVDISATPSKGGEKNTHKGKKEEDTPHIEVPYTTIFKEESPASNPEQVIRDYARAIEKSSKSESHNNFFQTQEDARMYYLRYRLPDFLIEHNVRIRNYLKNKSEEDVFTFKELMVRFLLEDEAYRIHPKNIEETERRFRHDSTIFDSFLESTDPFVQAFRRGNKITLPSREVELIIGVPTEEASLENREVFELQKQYVKLLGAIKHQMKTIDVEKVKAEILKEYFLHLELYSQEFKTLSAVYQDIGKMEVSDIQKRVARLKGVERNMKTLKKIQHEKGNVVNAIKAIERIIDGVGEIADLQLLYAYKFGDDFSDKYIQRYNNTLRLIQSQDKRQRQRGVEQLKYIAIDIHAQSEKLQKEIDSLLSETDLSHVPQAVVIQNNIEALCKDLFDADYYRVAISGKILDITREVLRDQITERKGLYKILSQFFRDKDFKHTKEKGGLFRSIDEYIDTVDLFETYSVGTISHEVKKTNNVEKIQSRLQELQIIIERFQSQRKIIEKNEIKLG